MIDTGQTIASDVAVDDQLFDLDARIIEGAANEPDSAYALSEPPTTFYDCTRSFC